MWIPKQPGEWDSLADMVTPERAKDEQNPRRLVVMFEKHESPYKWLLNTYDVSEETGYTFKSAEKFDCAPKRGGTGRSLFIVNHWIQPGGPPDPIVAARTNSEKTLTQRVDDCIETRGRIPNVIAVNFTSSGDLFKTVRRLNGAIARQSGLTSRLEDVISFVENFDAKTKKEAKGVAEAMRSIQRVKRLPRVTAKQALELLGPVADQIPAPSGLSEIVDPSVPTREEQAAESKP